MAIKTQGISFRHAWEHSDSIDVNEIQTNDIYAMLRIYGVEAARHTIQQQIEAVSGTMNSVVLMLTLDCAIDCPWRVGVCGVWYLCEPAAPVSDRGLHDLRGILQGSCVPVLPELLPPEKACIRAQDLYLTLTRIHTTNSR